MKLARTFALLLSLLAAVSLFAVDAPVISSVDPSSGPPGTLVTISGHGFALPPNFACFAPCPTVVFFDTTEVKPREESDTRLTVIAPAHAAGTVTLRIRTGDGREASSTFQYTASAEAAWQRVLLPVYVTGQVPGSNGSLWTTDFWIRNNSGNPEDSAALAPWSCEGQVCPPVFPSQRPLRAGETLHNIPPFFRAPTDNPARLLYITRSVFPKVSMNLRVADVSRGGLNAGTEIPIVRDEAFATSTIQLMNVPVDARFRLLLRVYDVTPSPAQFQVNVWTLPEGTTAPRFVSSTQLVATSPQTGEFRDLPSYAQLDLAAAIPSGTAGPLRIEVAPLSQGSRFWAFVSITNNETQLVTLVTPQ